MEGTVLAVGQGRLDNTGRRIIMNVKPGDKVLFAKYGGTEYTVDDIAYFILSERHSGYHPGVARSLQCAAALPNTNS